jgi:D-alanyl-D-alanine carboxypeptidase
LLGRLGAEFLTRDDDFSIRVETELNAAMQLAFNTYETPGLFAGLWVDGVGLWTGAAGEADWDTGAPYTANTYQRVGSVTKTFTATLILQLVDEGLLSLDDTLDGWFPEVPNSDQITLRMMLNMTSGVSDYSQSQAWQEAYFSDTSMAFTPAQLVEYIIPLTPSFAPGTGWEYSNSNYVLLGLIVETITGQPFHEALHERILNPLALAETVFPATGDTDLPEPFARGLTQQGITDDVKESTFWNTSWAFSAGELMATLEDLLVWGRVLGTGELLSAEAQAERLTWITTPPLSEDFRYGLGILYLSGWIGHDGLLPGYSTWLLYQPELDAVLVVMANTDIANADGIDPSLGALIGLLEIASRSVPPLYD